MDRETYKQIISRKTASLFRAAAHMGALMGGADEESAGAMADYAYNLGLTFQIVDDILDIIGDPETLGKPVGSDVAQKRGVVMAHNGGRLAATHREAGEAVAMAEQSDPIAQMLARLRESGAVEVARLQAAEMGQRARAALNGVPDSPARAEMLRLVDKVLDRQR
jgi:geranylgeranyl pyrophosphate synthase